MNSSNHSSRHLVVNWLTGRGEYSKAVRLNLWRHGFWTPPYFLISDFHFLSLQLHNGDRLPSVLLGLKQMFLNQRVRRQKLANPLAKCACSVSVNDPDSRLARERGVIQEFVQAIRSFLHGHADHVD